MVTEEEDFPRVLAWLTDERKEDTIYLYLSVKNLADLPFSSEKKQEPMPIYYDYG